MGYLCGMETEDWILYYRDLCVRERKALGYSQVEIGRLVGLSVSTIKRFERDGSIRLDNFLRLLKGLQIQIYVDYGR